MKPGTRAAIYARISDDREGREIGVDDQIQQCEAEAERAGLSVIDVYGDNDLSASTKARKRRPDYERLLADARAHRFDVIVALSTSRLTRRPREHEDLIDLATGSGIRYRFVKSPSFDLNTADGRMVARTLAAADAAEAERTAERVKDSVRGRAERGEFHGGPRPYGFEQDESGALVLVEAEADEIREWYPLVLAGGSLLGIVRDLNKRGVPSATGKPWRAPVLRKILINPRNAGLRLVGTVERKSPHPAIVDESVWRAVRAQLLGRSGPSTARKHLGAGLYTCKPCAAPVHSHVTRHGDRAYRCTICWRSWRAEPIDRWISDLVAGVLGREDARERLLPKRREGGVDVQALATERTAIEANMADLARSAVRARGATKAALEAGLEAGQARIDEIGDLVTEAGRTDAVSAILASKDPAATWRAVAAGGDVARSQAIVRGLMTITLGAPIRGRALWDPRKFITVTPVGQ